MRKILISILLILLIVLACFTIFRGISIGGVFKILSTGQIIELNDNLTAKIEEANRKTKSDLPSKEAELNENIEVLLKNKEEYYNLASISTESQMAEANTEESYAYEYLCLKIGRYARTEGVNLKMDVVSGSAGEEAVKDLEFTIIGQYFAIMNFVSDLEDDSELSFRIEDFNMIPNSGNNLQATFNVTGIRMILEDTTNSVQTTSNTSNN